MSRIDCPACQKPHLVGVGNVESVYPSFPDSPRKEQKLATAKASPKTTVICAACGEIFRNDEWQ